MNLLLLGHRGARATKSIPENSIESFDFALAHGCDGFEFDVRLSQDGYAVICHDPKYQRQVISRSTCAQLIGIPTLQQVLRRYAANAFLDIELKVDGLEEATLSALREHPPRKGWVISSFLPSVVTRLHDLDSATPLGIICENRKQLLRGLELPVSFVIAEKKLLTQELVEVVHTENRQIMVWTVNHRKDMLRFVEYGVDGVISDDTILLCNLLKSSAQA